MDFLIFLGCNYKQLPYLISIKKKYKIILIDKNNNNPGKKYAYLNYNCSYNDISGLSKIYGKIKKLNIKKVFTASSHYAHQGAAYFAKKFKLKYPLLKNIDICLDKSKFYPFFEKNKLLIPKTKYVKNYLQLKKELSKYN